jgi:hypothetical protein
MTKVACTGELRATLAHAVRRWRKKCDLPGAARYASAEAQNHLTSLGDSCVAGTGPRVHLSVLAYALTDFQIDGS